jgi:peptidoglycan/xylan/chitin deacetylase (PgdA/CDA1 family)
MLDVLSKLQKKATFFVLGERVLESPDLARELLSRGHEIALHGMVHRRHDVLAREEAMRELSSGLDAIEATVNYRPRWYRPPFGRASAELVSVCNELDLTMVYWTAWGHDWEAISASRISRFVLRDCDPGAIVLLHDSASFAVRNDAQPTVDAIPIIAEWAKSGGLQLTSLGAALDGAAR